MKQHDELVAKVIGLGCVIEMMRENATPVPPELSPLLDLLGSVAMRSLRDQKDWSPEEAVLHVQARIAEIKSLL